MAEFFIRNYPEAENGSTGKDTLPISATVTRRIWLKAYRLAGQPVANETRIRHHNISRSLPKYPIVVSKRKNTAAIRNLSQENMHMYVLYLYIYGVNRILAGHRMIIAYLSSFYESLMKEIDVTFFKRQFFKV